MKITTIFTILFLLFASADMFARDKQVQPWIHGVPADFPSIEKLFLNANCKFSFPHIYLYDTKTEHWLSYEEAATTLPNLANLLGKQKCDMNYTAVQLASILNVQWPEQKGIVALFFEPPTGSLEVFFKKGSPNRAKYDEKVLALEQLDTLPRYRIFTPMTGFKSQF